MSDTMSGQLLEGWSMVSAILFSCFFLFFEVFAIFPKMQKASKNQKNKKTKCQTLCLASSWKGGPWCLPFCFLVFFFLFFEVFAIFPKMQKASKNQKNKKTKCQTLCLASSWKGGPWCLPFCFLVFFCFSRFLPSSQKCKKLRKTKKTKKTKMSDTMSGQLLEGWSMVSAILFSCFFLFFRGFCHLPKNAKSFEKPKKPKCQTLCLASSWKGGPWCLPFCFFCFFFGFSRFLPSSQKCKKLRKTKKTKKTKMSDTMSGQLLEGWSMVSAILFFFVCFWFFEVFAIYVWPALGRVVHGVWHFFLFFLVFPGLCHLPKKKPMQNQTFQSFFVNLSSWLHQQPFDFKSSRSSSHWIAIWNWFHSRALRQSHRSIFCQRLIAVYQSSIDNISSSLETLRCMRSNDMDWEMDEEQLDKAIFYWYIIWSANLSTIC